MIPIIQKKNISFTISTILFTLSLILLVVVGIKPGIDFTGGTLIQLRFEGERPERAALQTVVEGLELGNVLIQPADNDSHIVKMAYLEEEDHQRLLLSVRTAYESEEYKVVEESVETIGPSISSDLRSRSIKAGFGVVIAIILFIAYSFRKVSKPVSSWKFGVTAIIALLHDVIITMGVFVLLGHFLGVEVGIPFVVAMLTILGYSVNDTIVVFDRIREKIMRKEYKNFAETVNVGVNETIPRSINTSVTTLLVLLGLCIFGGESVRFFSLSLVIGIILGTYSSLFLASPLLVWWEKK
ncbi:MAG: protein translocase subunit SecF [Candidatus Magasanikbacteria bacterium]|jgi:preprotein translocase subunit SecF|nr:protein translocase subunit SecF [Candidatus Magasanikbacteria bacterium]MBT5262446.1 protein translocase subunit SecF [Candidatus Magasanikbacteria bacterium]MBT5820441.1 protein translocase subunit SecF [Candidatus Magasanikbacteria bacterium]MBT6294455.1 protein translocase subunit SecF [Candidatus Magasanikbacteria bacterium]